MLISWRSVAAGSVVALAALIVLSLIGLGFGLGAVDVVEGDEVAATITGAVAVWWCVSAVVALFLGGWTAGRDGGGPFVPRAVLLATLVWAVTVLASLYLATTSVGTMLGGPITVATDSVYGVLAGAETQPLSADEIGTAPPVEGEAVKERAAAAQLLAAQAEGAMHAGLWAAFTLLLGAGAAIAGAWFATDPPAWSRPRSGA